MSIFTSEEERKKYVKCHKMFFDDTIKDGLSISIALKPFYVLELLGIDELLGIEKNSYNWYFMSVDGQFFYYTMYGEKLSKKNAYGKSRYKFLLNTDWFVQEIFITSCSIDNLFFKFVTKEESFGSIYAPYIPLQITGVQQNSLQITNNVV